MFLDLKPKDESRSLTYIIRNVVVKASLEINKNFNLNLIKAKLKDTEYNQERFPGLFVRLSRHALFKP